MKKILSVASGIATGDAIYQVIRHGIHEINWVKVGFMFVFSAVVLAAVASIRSARKNR